MGARGRRVRQRARRIWPQKEKDEGRLWGACKHARSHAAAVLLLRGPGASLAPPVLPARPRRGVPQAEGAARAGRRALLALERGEGYGRAAVADAGSCCCWPAGVCCAVLWALRCRRCEDNTGACRGVEGARHGLTPAVPLSLPLSLCFPRVPALLVPLARCCLLGLLTCSSCVDPCRMMTTSAARSTGSTAGGRSRSCSGSTATASPSRAGR